MSRTPASVRLPQPLREQLFAVAAAEDRTFSSLVIAILDNGLVARAQERELIRRMIVELDAEVVEDA